MQTLVTFAKDPRLGHSKSRLARTVGKKNALEIAQALLDDTVETVARIAKRDAKKTATSICFAPDDQPATEHFAAYGPEISSEPQRGETLGERLVHCFDDWFARGSKRVVVIGTDCPTVTSSEIKEAFEALHKSDVVLGPAADGGYYLIGLSSPQPDLFQTIDWSGPDVLTQTIAVIRERKLTLQLLPIKSDLDTADDMRPVFGQLDAYAAAGIPIGTATHAALAHGLNLEAVCNVTQGSVSTTQSNRNVDLPVNNRSPQAERAASATAEDLLQPRGSDSLNLFEVIHFGDIDPVACPCGQARRAFADAADFPATVHRTEITLDAKPHYHRTQTEVYVILECESDAALELDGKRVGVRVGSAILIRPGCIHRAVGQMKVLIICSPKFDANDEFVVDGSQH